MWRLAPSGQAFFVPYAGVEYVERQEVDAPPPLGRIVIYGILGNGVAMLLGGEL